MILALTSFLHLVSRRPTSRANEDPAAFGGLYSAAYSDQSAWLDSASGKLLWSFNPNASITTPLKSRNRGLNYWTDGKSERIYFAVRERLFSLDAKTGKPDPQFGKNGVIDLREGLGRNVEDINISLTTPRVIYHDRLIVGGITSEDVPAAPSDIRAYNVRTGALEWAFHTIPRPGEPGYDTWPKDAWKYTGAANDWLRPVAR